MHLYCCSMRQSAHPMCADPIPRLAVRVFSSKETRRWSPLGTSAIALCGCNHRAVLIAGLCAFCRGVGDNLWPTVCFCPRGRRDSSSSLITSTTRPAFLNLGTKLSLTTNPTAWVHFLPLALAAVSDREMHSSKIPCSPNCSMLSTSGLLKTYAVTF